MIRPSNDISVGQLLLEVSTEKSNYSLSCSYKEIVKKQYFKSITIIGHALGNKAMGFQVVKKAH